MNDNWVMHKDSYHCEEGCGCVTALLIVLFFFTAWIGFLWLSNNVLEYLLGAIEYGDYGHAERRTKP